MTDAFDHVRVASLLRIIHDTVNVPGLEPIRDAAADELTAVAAPLRVARAKAVADAKAKAAKQAADAQAKHAHFVPATAANLTALKLAMDDAEAAAEKVPTPENIATHEAAAKAYADALKAAEAAPDQHLKDGNGPHNVPGGPGPQPRAFPSGPGPTSTPSPDQPRRV